MALTARATEPPTWESQIVPTLRKRLEHESRALSKRMSLTGPSDDQRLPPPSRVSNDREPPSHIPRPGTQSPPAEQTPKSRSRTHSTPRPFERDMPTPASSRPTSPAAQTTPRPSRIPTRPRTGSRQIGANDTTFPPSPDPSPDLWPVQEDALIRTELTPPTPEQAARRRKRETFVPPPASDNDEILFDEPAPFVISNTNTLGGRSSLDEYEHWYRGEGRGGGGRNGGRGEIRIATRTEMLEIASFGHPPSRSNSQRGNEYGEFGWRSKAYDDSTVGTRFMWYDENAENVLDEAPLTDLDDVDSESIYPPGSHEAHTVDSHPQDARSISPQEDARSVEPDPEPDGPSNPVTPARPPPSRIARATSPTARPGASTTSLASRPGHSPTPSKIRSPPPKAQSPPPTKPQSPKPKPTPRRAVTAGTPSKSPSRAAGTSQLGPPSGSTPKSQRKGTSPSNTPSPRARAQSSSRGRTKKLSTGGSGPHPLADAIPQILPDQLPDDGNWDDVVLPTVARRMQGEDVLILERKPREEKEELIPPAPGTFGYLERQREQERAKQREKKKKRDSGTDMGEFGAWEGVGKRPKPETEERNKAPSPPPFSDYTPTPPLPPTPAEPVQRPPSPAEPKARAVITEAELRHALPSKDKSNRDDSHGSACCKCVVM